MPIHLRPISRRQFVARALAAGAAAIFAPELLAARRRSDPGSWVLFSDVHIAGDPVFKAREINMTEHFNTASQQVLRLPQAPAGLFITGDCAYNSGQPEDYRQLARLLDRVRVQNIPVHLALGNHDDREQCASCFPDGKRLPGSPPGKRVSWLPTKHVNWLMLDSLEKTLVTPGLLGSEQLAWLARTLDANRRKPAVVLVHHNPGLEGGNMGLKDTVALMEVLRPRKQVKAYIYGHTHAWKVEQDASGLHLINLPPVAYVFREGDPSGWVHAAIDRNGMTLQLHCIDERNPRAGEVVRLAWRK
jgi:hypothetical protein